MLDDALVLENVASGIVANPCLNPCCAGRCSSTLFRTFYNLAENVSILVVLDDALVQFNMF